MERVRLLSQQGNAAKADSNLDHMCALDIDSEPYSVRMTGLICTIGPACDSVRHLTEMMEAGMNICRLNLAHGSYDYHGLVIKNIREAVSRLSLPTEIAIAVDIPGPGVRLGRLRLDLGGEIHLTKGHKIKLTTDLHAMDEGTAECLYVDHQELIDVCQNDSRIFIEDGPLTLVVIEKGHNYVQCVVETAGSLCNRDFCNIPSGMPSTPTLSVKDSRDIQFIKDHNVDIIMASFVSSAQQVCLIREALGDKYKHVKIVAKIENNEGFIRFNEVVHISDGIMVARGNLGIGIAPEKVFLAQKSIIGRANKAQKPVIVATQILDSMTDKPRPTRAEVSDIANAILDGADCLMLSKETAKGKYPVKALQTLCAVCQEAEAAVYHKRLFHDLLSEAADDNDCTHTMAIASVEAAFKCSAQAIIVLTSTGRSACLIAAYRPRCVIIAVTRNQHTSKFLQLYRGILPLYHPDRQSEWLKDVDSRIERALYLGKKRGYLHPGNMVVLVTGWQAGSGATNTVRLIPVPAGDDLPYQIFSEPNTISEA